MINTLLKAFTPETLDQRKANKISLQEEVGLEVNRNAFLIGMVTRLVEQKGFRFSAANSRPIYGIYRCPICFTRNRRSLL